MIEQMITDWIAKQGIGTVDQYDIAGAARMAQQWANEDTNGVVSALPAEAIEGIIESYRGVPA
jgi:hypothetical protein